MFRSFVVDEKIIPEELDNEEKASYEEEMASLTNFYDTLFPGTIRSPYTYGEVYELIYGVTEANDIISITAEPSDANNTISENRSKMILERTHILIEMILTHFTQLRKTYFAMEKMGGRAITICTIAFRIVFPRITQISCPAGK